MKIGWTATAGSIYGVQASSNLPAGAWFNVPGSTFTATVSGVVGYTNQSNDRMLFFRPIRNP